MASVRNDLGIFVQHTLLNFERWGFPFFAASFQFFVRYTQLEGVLNGIDLDDVAVSHQRDRAAYLGFWDDMADDEPVRPVM